MSNSKLIDWKDFAPEPLEPWRIVSIQGYPCLRRQTFDRVEVIATILKERGKDACATLELGWMGAVIHTQEYECEFHSERFFIKSDKLVRVKYKGSGYSGCFFGILTWLLRPGGYSLFLDEFIHDPLDKDYFNIYIRNLKGEVKQ